MPRVALLVSLVAVVAMTAACTQSNQSLPATSVVTTTVAIPAPPPTSTRTPAATATAPPKTATLKVDTAASRKAACLKDETQCYEPGTNIKCSTGGCVNAARGLTQADVASATQKWLREHPGWCAAGETGAVAPC
ncbi:hypothetical protein [Amycolatopsis sp. NPDC059657]|uniref:hypothetical protein n=1 Tax=Amycolatopsis sp. NPDC059657 TaxID=3346899 RepID=UPI003672DCC2